MARLQLPDGASSQPVRTVLHPYCDRSSIVHDTLQIQTMATWAAASDGKDDPADTMEEVTLISLLEDCTA